jgi:hypothetical protein
MNLRSPIAAMLWEQWRLSRVEAGQRLVLGLLATSAVLSFRLGPDNGPGSETIALWILIVSHAFFWFSIAKLNGGRFMDGYKPGFPLYLLYSRPVSTALCVGIAMAYDAISCAVLYIVSAALLGLAFGEPFPLAPVAGCIVAYHLASTCIQWSTRNRIVQWVGSIVVFWPMIFLLKSNMTAPLAVEFSFGDYALLLLVCMASFGLTVAGVARQRRGDAVVQEPRMEGWNGYPVWLVNLFRSQCPTSSPARAQVWFELRSSGLPVIMIGLGLAVLILLLFAIGIFIGPAREAAIGISVLSVPVVLFLFGGNAFGIRSRQGRTYAASFEVTQPFGTTQMAGLKVLVRTLCVLVALLAILVSFWLSMSLIGSWGHWSGGGNDASAKLLDLRQKIMDTMGAWTVFTQVAVATLASAGVACLVAWQAAREALKVRYPRRVLIAQWLPAAWGITIGLLGLAGAVGILSHDATRRSVMAVMWIATAGLVSATIYLLWSSLAERLLNGRYVGGAAAILAAFGTAYVALLWSAGTPLSEMPWTVRALFTWPLLLLLLGCAIAPWAFNRLRHT